MATVTSINNFDAKDITLSELKSSGKYDKINIMGSDEKKTIIEAEEFKGTRVTSLIPCRWFSRTTIKP